MSEMNLNDNNIETEESSSEEQNSQPSEDKFSASEADSADSAADGAAPEAEEPAAPEPELSAPVGPENTEPEQAEPQPSPESAEYQYTSPRPETPRFSEPPRQESQQPQYQQSRGFYQPYGNEYVYSPQPPKKKSSVGKVVLIAIAAILSVFVISIGSISIYNYLISTGRIEGNSYLTLDRLRPANRETPPLDSYGNPSQEVNIGDDDDDDEFDNDVDIDDEESIETSEPTVIRDFPTLEQLAAPEDALSIPDIYEKVSPSVVGVSTEVYGGTQTGTGFVISEDGYIITNAHVIDGFIEVSIVDSEMNTFEAEVIGYDTQTDIAVLKVDPETIDLVPVEFGKSGELRIGELAIAIGNPPGFDYYGTMTTGIISGLNRSVTVSDKTMTLLQTNALINNGNSGGPLIDAYGRVIGITSVKINSYYGEGMGFAIPIDDALPIVENLIRYGYIPGRPSIGISGEDIDEITSWYYRTPKGVFIWGVEDGSGADKAGIKVGDTIIGADGESITSMNELTEIKNKHSVGDTMILTVYRDGENFDVRVTLGETTQNN